MVKSSFLGSFQIAEVVSDVFGSSKYSPLVPQTPPTDSPTLKKTTNKNTNGQKGMYEPALYEGAGWHYVPSQVEVEICE